MTQPWKLDVCELAFCAFCWLCVAHFVCVVGSLLGNGDLVLEGPGVHSNDTLLIYAEALGNCVRTESWCSIFLSPFDSRLFRAVLSTALSSFFLFEQLLITAVI